MTDSKKTRDPFADVEIRASAGTGKTYTLSVQYLGLINAGVPVDHILATTFTRKAAGEITGRLFERLAEAILDPKEQSTLATDLADSSLDGERCQSLLSQLTRELHRIRVGTLDSYFSQIARNYCFEMDLPPDWSIIDPVRYDEIVRRSTEEVISSHLNSGTHTSRLAHLLPNGISQRSLSDLVSQTVDGHYSLYKKTSRECWSAIEAEGLLSESELATLTKHIASAPLPDDRRAVTARDDDLQRVTDREWEDLLNKGLMKGVVKAAHGGQATYYRKPTPDETVALYRQLMAHAVAVLLQPVIRQTSATYDLLDNYHMIFLAAKRMDGSLTFDDVASALHTSLVNHDALGPDFRLDATVDHLLLDEFQDTSLQQWEILLPLARHVTSTPSAADPRSLFFVGDTKQAIFGWRGGRREIFDVARDNLDTSLDRDDLVKSWRSAEPIMDAVNFLFNNLLSHPNLDTLAEPIANWETPFPSHKTVHTEMQGGVEFLHVPAAGTTKEDQYIASLQQMSDKVKEISSHHPDASIGVLTRNRKFARRAIQQLRSAGLEVSGEGGVSLDDTSPNQAVLSLLALVDHPGDQVSHYHVSHSPLGNMVGLSPSDDQDDIYHVTDALRTTIQQQGYGPFLESLADGLQSSCSRRQFYRLHQLVDLAYDFQPLRPSRTHEFREHVRLSKIEDPSSARIRVMTIHSSKGLEFDAVVLPQLNESIDHSANRYAVGRTSSTGPIDRVLAYFKKGLQNALPPELRVMYQDAVTEQAHDALCVLYVALTRAKHGLHVILPYNPARKSFPRTLSGLVETAIGAPLNPDATIEIPSFGNPAWYLDLEPRPEDAIPTGNCGTASVRLQTLDDGLAVPSPVVGRRFEPVTPSSQEGESILAITELLGIGQEGAMSRGTVIHEWLEKICWLEDGLPTDDTMQLDIQRNEVDASVIDQFHQILEFPQVARLLDQQSYQELTDLECNTPLREELARAPFELKVYQEFPLSALHKSQHFNGNIDRLVLATREGKVLGADIIDYKTDRIDPEDPDRTLEARSEYYRGQLDIYARGLSASMQIPLEMINTRLAFVGAGIVTRVAPR